MSHIDDQDYENASYCMRKGWIDPFHETEDAIDDAINAKLRAAAARAVASASSSSGWFGGGSGNNSQHAAPDIEEERRFKIIVKALEISSRIAFLEEGKDSNLHLVQPISHDGIIRRPEEALGLLCRQLWNIEMSMLEKRRRVEEEQATRALLPVVRVPLQRPSNDDNNNGNEGGMVATVANESEAHLIRRATEQVEAEQEERRRRQQQQQDEREREGGDGGSCIFM